MSIDINKLLDEADALISTFMYDMAIEKYNTILSHTQDCADAFLMRGALLGEIGRLDHAISDIKKSTEIDDGNDSAFLTLAYLYEKKNHKKQAIECCCKAIALNNTTEAVNLLVKLCKHLGNEKLEQSLLDKAESYFKLALKYKHDAEILYRLALVARHHGKIEDSIQLAQEAVEVNPEHIRAHAHIASSYELLGNTDKGDELIKRLFQSYPDHPMVSIIYAQYALRIKDHAAGIDALKNTLSKQNLQIHDLVSIKMFLGKLYDAKKDYDSAFYYFKQANDYLDQAYAPSSYQDYISTLIDNFSKTQYATMPSSDNISDELIFITGMPRSGTTLIEQIISSHSSVFGAGELSYVNDLSNTLQVDTQSASPYPLCMSELNKDNMNALAKKLIENIRKENNSSIKIIDKMPSNFHHIGLLHKLLPNAKIINCVRDARDTCLSCYFQNFTGYHPYASNLTALGIHYREYERLMNHWTQELNIPVLTVSYEALIANTREEIEKILNFLELDWQEECVNFYQQKRTVATASYDQVNKKIYKNAMGRWSNYQTHIGDLLSALKR